MILAQIVHLSASGKACESLPVFCILPDTVATIRFKYEKKLVPKGKQNLTYKSTFYKLLIAKIQLSTIAERKFKI